MSLADAIIRQDVHAIEQMLRHEDINGLDEYGFTPLIEAAIIDSLQMTKLLLQKGADANGKDVTGATALHWAVENNNLALCELLLKNDADPNSYNLAGQPVLVMPTLRRQPELKRLLLSFGADQVFTDDYINTKLLGHMFELVGNVDIVTPANQYVDVDFEGFFLEVTLGLVADSLYHFQNHFAARQLKRYSTISKSIVSMMQRATRLIKFQQYQVNLAKHMQEIDELVMQDPCIIPVGYEGHAITFIRFGELWIKCDRREDSRLYDNVMIYQINNIKALTPNLIKSLVYVKQSHDFINHELDRLLGLTPITEIKVEAQISGNCSWANVEATIPALFFLILMQTNQDEKSAHYFKTLSLSYFHRWREWNKDRALHLCIESFNNGDAIRRASKAEILAAILFQSCQRMGPNDRKRSEEILSVLIGSKYEYVLRNYLQVYFYQSNTDEGRRFYELMKENNIIN